MKIFFLFGSVLGPVLMLIGHIFWDKLSLFLNAIAAISAIVLGNILSFAIYDVIKDSTVFMTNIHGLILNPFFLATGAYLGIYFIYRMMLLTFMLNKG